MMVLVRDRLAGLLRPHFKLFETAAAFAALQAPPAQLPAIFVLPIGSQASANTLATGMRQRVLETTGVVILSGNLRDPRGGAAAADIEELRAMVRGALVGWSPGAAWEPMQLGTGRLLDITEGVLAWQETFTSATQLRAT